MTNFLRRRRARALADDRDRVLDQDRVLRDHVFDRLVLLCTAGSAVVGLDGVRAVKRVRSRGRTWAGHGQVLWAVSIGISASGSC